MINKTTNPHERMVSMAKFPTKAIFIINGKVVTEAEVIKHLNEKRKKESKQA